MLKHCEYPAKRESALKLVDRIIYARHGYHPPPLEKESVSGACPEVHTRYFQDFR